MIKEFLKLLVANFKQLFGSKKNTPAALSIISEPTFRKNEEYFAAIAKDRVCVSGYINKFMAIKENDKWRIGYPEFDDLMDNFSEVKDWNEVERHSIEARNALKIFSN
jgi:hypothetical protein